MTTPADGGAFLAKLENLTDRVESAITEALDFCLDDEDWETVNIMLLNMAAKHNLLN